MSLCVRSCTFFIKWCFTKLHETSSSKRLVSWPSRFMSCINVASWFFTLILRRKFSLVVVSRGSSLPDRSDAWQERRDQESVWQHPGYYWCKRNTVWRTRCTRGHMKAHIHIINANTPSVKVSFDINACSVFLCDSSGTFPCRNMMRNGAVKFKERSFVCIITSGWRWLKIGRLTNQILTCMITTIESIFSTVQVRIRVLILQCRFSFSTCKVLFLLIIAQDSK